MSFLEVLGGISGIKKPPLQRCKTTRRTSWVQQKRYTHWQRVQKERDLLTRSLWMAMGIQQLRTNVPAFWKEWKIASMSTVQHVSLCSKSLLGANVRQLAGTSWQRKQLLKLWCFTWPLQTISDLLWEIMISYFEFWMYKCKVGDSCLKKPFALNLCTLAQASPIDSVVLHPAWCPQVGDWGLPCPLNGRISFKMQRWQDVHRIWAQSGKISPKMRPGSAAAPVSYAQMEKKTSNELLVATEMSCFSWGWCLWPIVRGLETASACLLSRKDVKRSSLQLPRSRALPKALAPNVVGGLDGLCSLKLA